MSAAAEDVVTEAPAVEAVSNQLFLWLEGEQRTLANGDTKYKQGQVTGVSANYASVTNINIAEGRFFNEIDDQHKRDVMVIGGFLVGVFENLAGTYIPGVGNELKLPIALALIITVLVFKPAGLFGRPIVKRV